MERCAVEAEITNVVTVKAIAHRRLSTSMRSVAALAREGHGRLGVEALMRDLQLGVALQTIGPLGAAQRVLRGDEVVAGCAVEGLHGRGARHLFIVASSASVIRTDEAVQPPRVAADALQPQTLEVHLVTCRVGYLLPA